MASEALPGNIVVITSRRRMRKYDVGRKEITNAKVETGSHQEGAKIWIYKQN
ncbi:Hypothetical predicted protein [Pelobates cultripes]|uniref:Uncharacterized protein n=1 Tax=Pelobates cultripes TaxID=61616 RepID=A0AAD1VR42_PELCU|nr:Hypothetical predicted protein [Pelobates cultripes]